MGLLSFTREVVTEYSADVSEHVAALEELEGAEAELAAQELELANARAEQADSFLGNLAKVTLAYEGLKEAGEVVWDGYLEGVKEARLETQAAGVDLEALSAAANGTMSHMELLDAAAKANTSSYQISQSTLQGLIGAEHAYVDAGYDEATVHEAVNNAILGRVRGLQALGIAFDTDKTKLDDNGNALGTYAQKQELVNNALNAFVEKGKLAAIAGDDVGDSMKQTQTKLTDSWDELKKGLGSLVESMKPLLDALASAVGLVGKLADAAGGSHDVSGVGDLSILDWLSNVGNPGHTANFVVKNAPRNPSSAPGTDAFAAAIAHGAAQANAQAALKAPPPEAAADVNMDGAEMNVSADVKAASKNYQDALAQSMLKNAYIDASSAGGALGDPDMVTNKSGVSKAQPWYDTQRYTGLGVAASTNPGGSNGSMDRVGAGDGKFTAGNEQSILEDVQKQSADAQKLQFAQNETMLSKTFGKVGDLDLYKKGFDALTTTVGSMYDAIVSGSEPAAQAIRKAIGASVEAVGKQMSIEALKEAAYAIGDLAIGNVAGAGQHATAAAEFAAGAIIAGVVASELGAGSSGSSSSGSSGSSGGSSGGGGSSSGGSSSGSATPATSAPVIVIGNSFADDTPRMRQNKAQQLVSLALGSTPAGTSS